MLYKHKLKFLPIFMIVALLASVLSLNPSLAATLTEVSDTMTDQTLSEVSDHTVMFTTPTGVASTEVITLTFSSTSGTSFAIPAGLDFSDIDLSYDETPDNDCSAGETAATLVGSSATTSEWDAVRTSATVITLTSGGASATIPAAAQVCVKVGANATGGDQQITNPDTASTASVQHRLAIAAGADSHTIALAVVDSSTVSITASVDASLTFDLDTATTNSESASGYSVALGTLTTADVATSDNTTINSIYTDISTNAVGGAVISVASLNGALLRSGGAETIPSAAATLAAGTAGYGICVTSAATAPVSGSTTGGPLTIDTDFDGSCTSGAHEVGALTTSAQPILTTSDAPIGNGRAEIFVKAAISPLTPAGSYSDTLTFTATGTF